MYSLATSTEANYKGEVKSAETWRQFIAGGRSKTSRKAANNTVVRMNDQGGAVIRLHDTDIVTIGTAGRVRLNSGGWLSVTTKERINRYTNAGISQRKGIWYMSDGSLFYDGMIINADGTPEKPRATKKYETELAKIKKQARAYAQAFVAALQAGEVPYPSAGDCWACCMRGLKGQETFQGSGHIQDHIEENYYVPSLLVNAGRAAGYRDDQIGLMGIGGHRLFVNPEHTIYKYVVRKLQGEL